MPYTQRNMAKVLAPVGYVANMLICCYFTVLHVVLQYYIKGSTKNVVVVREFATPLQRSKQLVLIQFSFSFANEDVWNKETNDHCGIETERMWPVSKIRNFIADITRHCKNLEIKRT